MLEPGYATAHQWYGEIPLYQRRLEEGLAQHRLARIADPLSAVVIHLAGYSLLWNFRLDEAEERHMEKLEPDQPLRWTIQNLELLNSLRGYFEEARKRAR
jgi:hypothetical protein